VHRWLRPTSQARTVYDIDLGALVARGIRGMILDLDNTIVPWGAHAVPQGLLGWVCEARAAGLQLCIVSNNSGRRVADLAGALGVPVLTGARKPTRGALRRALVVMGTTPETTALVGDQVLTDVLGGNRLGLHTILVERQSSHEFVLTRLTRVVEWWVLRGLRRRPAGRPPRAGER